jgi:tetratricopeptide (TPR) repeat protein
MPNVSIVSLNFDRTMPPLADNYAADDAAPAAPRSAIRLLQQALTVLAQGQAGAAIAPATQAVALDPTLAIAWQILGKAHAQLGATPAAIVAYKQATSCYIALQDAENARLCVAAIEALARSTVPLIVQPLVQPPLMPPPVPLMPLDPAVAQQFLNRAIGKRDQGDYENALEDVEWLLQLEPDESQALALRTQIIELMRQAQILRVPVKSYRWGTSVVEVKFNDQYTFDLIVDTGATQTTLSNHMARIMNLPITRYSLAQVADGRMIRVGYARVATIAVGAAQLRNIEVSVLESDTDGLLGQDFLSAYNLRIFADAIEFHPK